MANLTALKLRIETSCFTESKAFYCDLLGLNVIESWSGDGPTGSILGLSNDIEAEGFLELAEAEQTTSHQGLSIQIRVDDLDKLRRKLDGKIDYTGPTMRPWGSVYLYLVDPNGIQVIVYEGRI